MPALAIVPELFARTPQDGFRHKTWTFVLPMIDAHSTGGDGGGGGNGFGGGGGGLGPCSMLCVIRRRKVTLAVSSQALQLSGQCSFARSFVHMPAAATSAHEESRWFTDALTSCTTAGEASWHCDGCSRRRKPNPTLLLRFVLTLLPLMAGLRFVSKSPPPSSVGAKSVPACRRPGLLYRDQRASHR